jgi:hypothetical protein
MFEPDLPIESDDGAVESDDSALQRIYQQAPIGALTIAGIGTASVFALWLAFYLLVFLPRGLLH